MAWRIKRFSNDELRQKFVDVTVPQAEVLGLSLPDPELRWNPAIGPLPTSAPSTGTSSRAVVRGNGPCNRQRIAHRVAAHEDGRLGARRGLSPMRRKQPRHRGGHGVMHRAREWPLWEVFVRSRAGSLPPARRQPARRRRGDGAAQRPRRLHAPQEGVSHLGRPRRARSPPPRPTRRTRSSTRPAISCTATRPSTTCPTGCSTCEPHEPTLAIYALRLGDDALILVPAAGRVVLARARARGGHRAHQHRARPARPGAGPAHARRRREGRGRDEDDLAYLRDEREFLNCPLVEQQNGDFAHTIARQLLFSTYQLALYAELTASADATSPASPAKAVKEVAYHRDHASSGRCASATAPRRATAGCAMRSTGSGRIRRAVRIRRGARPVGKRGRRRRPRRDQGRLGAVQSRRCSRSRRSRFPSLARVVRRAADVASTVRSSDTCWRRCSGFIAPTPG